MKWIAIRQSPSPSALRLREQSRVPFLGQGYVVQCPQAILWTPPTPDTAQCVFVSLDAPVDVPLTSLYRASSTGLIVFRCMPPLLPREIAQTVSVVQTCARRPSPYVHWVGISIVTDEATCRFAFAAARCFAVWELTTSDCSDAAPSCYQGVRTTPWAGLEPARQSAVTAHGR
jgi:hypothetical protein